MKRPIRAVVPAALLAWLAAGAGADPPPAMLDIDFSGEAAIWNPFEGFDACEEDWEGSELCLSLSGVVCDGKGNCSGDATWDLTGLFTGTLTGTFTARVKCKEPKQAGDDVCIAQIRGCETSGSIDFDGGSVEASISKCRIKGPVDDGGTLAGSGKARICVDSPPGKLTCDTVSGAFVYEVNAPTDWTLSLDLANDDGALTGTAMDSLGFDYTVKGRYDGGSDSSKLSLKGDRETPSRGAKIAIKDLTVVGGSATGGSAKLSVQGNRSTPELD